MSNLFFCIAVRLLKTAPFFSLLTFSVSSHFGLDSSSDQSHVLSSTGDKWSPLGANVFVLNVNPSLVTLVKEVSNPWLAVKCS